MLQRSGQAVDLILGIADLALDGDHVFHAGCGCQKFLQAGHLGLCGLQTGLDIVITFGHIPRVLMERGDGGNSFALIQKGIQVFFRYTDHVAGCPVVVGTAVDAGIFKVGVGTRCQVLELLHGDIKLRGFHIEVGRVDDLEVILLWNGTACAGRAFIFPNGFFRCHGGIFGFIVFFVGNIAIVCVIGVFASGVIACWLAVISGAGITVIICACSAVAVITGTLGTAESGCCGKQSAGCYKDGTGSNRDRTPYFHAAADPLRILGGLLRRFLAVGICSRCLSGDLCQVHLRIDRFVDIFVIHIA